MHVNFNVWEDNSYLGIKGTHYMEEDRHGHDRTLLEHNGTRPSLHRTRHRKGQNIRWSNLLWRHEIWGWQRETGEQVGKRTKKWGQDEIRGQLHSDRPYPSK